ncbi:MAG: bifunctional protein-disulfide isomerase/oxidoreductase DsbC [Gammaproteobacteria bacterium]|nr:bifunctional protein-disulfide isomerase/oxidoreductase DsbC [Gammaproteobacteria bacterium]
MLKRTYLWLPLLAWIGLAQADNAEMKSKLEAMMPGITIDGLQPLDNTGLYEAVINGEIIYFSEDARYVFQGDVTALETRENITENKRVKLRQETLASLNEADMIVYEPKKTEHTLTVFTDIDCGYCRKLHNQMDEYNDLGIRIRYMAFPRAGIDSESFEKAEDVWCSDDRQQAMTDAKNGKSVDSKSCDTPVKAQYQLGRRIGVTGTPALFLESGQMLPGYVPPKRLKKILDEQAAL